MIDLDVRRNFFAGHGMGRDETRSRGTRDRTGRKKQLLAGDGTGRISDAAGRDGTEKTSSRRSLVNKALLIES
jgi:hypothetical protein